VKGLSALGGLGAALVTVPLVLAGCGTQYAGSTVAQQVESWATTSPDPTFASAVSTLKGDLRHVAEAQTSSDAALLRTDCDVLVTDALSANQNLPTPDSQLTDVLSSAYASAVSAGQDCFCAAGGRPCRRGPTSSGSLLKRAAQENSRAERGFIEAQARVDTFRMLAKDSGS
jgi:hypothetical protein